MSRYVARSRCECQALLVAELDEEQRVLSGSAVREGIRERAPAHAIGTDDADRFDIGWLCPFCNRNTLRSFYVQALQAVAVERTAP